MSILSSISYYTAKALETLGVKETPNTNDAQKTSNVSIMPQKTKPTGDEIEISNNAKDKQKKEPANQKTAGAIKDSIEIKCKKYGINDKFLIAELKNQAKIFEKVNGGFSDQEELLLWENFEKILDYAIEIANEQGISPKVSLHNIVLEMAKQYREDVEQGNAIDISEAFKHSKRDAADIRQKRYRNKTRKEKKALINDIYKARRKEQERNIKIALRSCPKEQRAELEKRMRAQYEYENKTLVARFTAEYGTDDGMGLFLSSPKSLSKNLNFITNVIKNEDDKQEFIDNIKYEFTLEVANNFYERDEKADGKEIKLSNTSLMSQKSKEAVIEYQEGYLSARLSGKYQRLEEDGIFTMMAAGNSAGVQVNTNMTVEERVQFLDNFYKSEAQFGDLDVVIKNANEAVETYLEEHPESSENLKQELKEISEKTEEECKQALKISEQNSKNKTTENKTTQNTSKTLNPEKEIFTKNLEFPNPENTSKPNNKMTAQDKTANPNPNTSTKKRETGQTTNPNKIVYSLMIGENTLEEVLEQNNSRQQIYRILFSNNNLLSLYEKEAVEYIKNQHKVDDVIELANSSKAIELIMNYNNVNNKEELYEKLEQKASSTQKYMFKEQNEKQYT